MKTVEIVWIDACFRMKDFTPKSVKKCKPRLTRSIGYLAAETDDAIVICQTQDERNDRSEVLTVPWGMIVEYWEYENG